jgi:hypothetical protein
MLGIGIEPGQNKQSRSHKPRPKTDERVSYEPSQRQATEETQAERSRNRIRRQAKLSTPVEI